MESCSQEQHVVYVIPDRLAWILSRQAPRHRDRTFCFNTEEMLAETMKLKELQPPSLLTVSKFVEFLSGILKDPKYNNSQIFYHSTLDQKQKLNTCFLLSVFEIIHMNKSPEEILAKYKGISFVTYGSNASLSYSLMDSLRSINRTYRLGLFSLSPQRSAQYEKYRSSKQGAITMLIPHKLLVFEWPKGQISMDLKKFMAMTINKYSKALSHFNVTEMLRIHVDEQIDEYDVASFRKYGMGHKSLTTYNGQQPEYDFFLQTLAILEKEGIYAVCSQDDFGVSVLIVCVYLTKKHGLKPLEVIPWVKMMVPGCLTPKQIAYYKEKYEYMTGYKKYITINNSIMASTIGIHQK